MKFDPAFKEAIRQLSSNEKDKLILRLLKRDEALARRLQFELVSVESVEDRRTKMEARVLEAVGEMRKGFYSWGYLLMDMRYLSGEITEHVKTTKDKFGEISLQLLQLSEWLKVFVPVLNETAPGNTHKMRTYIITKTYKILLLIVAIHEDYRVEFRDDLYQLGMAIGNCDTLMRAAIYNGLDVNWLINDAIPDTIKTHFKTLRESGFLK